MSTEYSVSTLQRNPYLIVFICLHVITAKLLGKLSFSSLAVEAAGKQGFLSDLGGTQVMDGYLLLLRKQSQEAVPFFGSLDSTRRVL